MTAPRVGVDLVALSRARQLVDLDHRTILSRMLCSEEIDECHRAGALDPSAVAGRLAVKEAVFKLLRTTKPVVPWHDIVVRAPAGSWPEVRLNGLAATLAEESGLAGPVAVSVSHDGDYAVGVATALAGHDHTTPTITSGNDQRAEEHHHVPADDHHARRRDEVDSVQTP
jgi:holo-[acyl-carrier protein] synthase